MAVKTIPKPKKTASPTKIYSLPVVRTNRQVLYIRASSKDEAMELLKNHDPSIMVIQELEAERLDYHYDQMQEIVCEPAPNLEVAHA